MQSTRWALRGIGIAIVLSAQGCESKAPAIAASGGAAPSANAAAATLKLGAPIAAGPKVPLATIAHDVTKYANGAVTTEGKVTAVCQAMGCWMEITDAASQAHIRMTGHSFFIPKTASGRRAVVQGTVLPRPDTGECEQEAEQATGRTVKIELDATGVELL